MAFAVASLQQDLAAYWIAGKARWLGLDPYVNYCGSSVAPRLCDGVSFFRHSRFLYPPLAAELFRLLAIVPYRFAKVLFTGAAVASWLLTARHRGPASGRPPRGRRRRDRRGRAVLPALPPSRARADRPSLAAAGACGVAATRSRLPRGRRAGARGDVQAGAAGPAARDARARLPALGRWRRSRAAPSRRPPPLRSPGRAWSARTSPTCCRAPRSTAKAAPTRCCCATSTVRTRTATASGSAWTASRTGSRVPPFDGPASASLPRLLAPRSPHWATSVLPFAILMTGLAWVARRLPRRSERRPTATTACSTIPDRRVPAAAVHGRAPRVRRDLADGLGDELRLGAADRAAGLDVGGTRAPVATAARRPGRRLDRRARCSR